MKIFGYKKNQKKNKTRLPLSAYLSYFLVATLLVVGVSFSKYATTGLVGSGASVAGVTLEVGVTADFGNINTDSGNTDSGNTDTDSGNIDVMNGVTESSCEFYVANGSSEVALKYDVIVTVPTDFPEGLTVKLFNSQGVECAVVKSGNEYIFTGGTFDASVEATHNYTLTVSVVNEESLIDVWDKLVEINISVTAEQII